MQVGPTRLGEPGAGGVGVDGVEADHLVGLGALADGHADEGVLVLRDHQHLKHLQRARQGEVNVLEGGSEVPFTLIS